MFTQCYCEIIKTVGLHIFKCLQLYVVNKYYICRKHCNIFWRNICWLVPRNICKEVIQSFMMRHYIFIQHIPYTTFSGINIMFTLTISFMSEAPCSARSELCLSTSCAFSASDKVTDLRLRCFISTMSARVVTLFDLMKFSPPRCFSPVSSFTWTATTMATTNAQHQAIFCE